LGCGEKVLHIAQVAHCAKVLIVNKIFGEQNVMSNVTGSGSVDANVKLGIDSSEIDAYLERYDAAMDGKNPTELKQELKEVQEQADDINRETDKASKNLDAVERRYTRMMMPELQKADRIMRDIGKIQAGNMMGVMGLGALVLSLLQRVMALEEEKKRKEKEFQRTAMTYQNFSSQEQFNTWNMQQKSALNASRNIR